MNGTAVTYRGDGLGICATTIKYTVLFVDENCFRLHYRAIFIRRKLGRVTALKVVTIDGSNHSAALLLLQDYICDLVYFTVTVIDYYIQPGTYNTGAIGVHVDNHYYLDGAFAWKYSSAAGCLSGVVLRPIALTVVAGCTGSLESCRIGIYGWTMRTVL